MYRFILSTANAVYKETILWTLYLVNKTSCFINSMHALTLRASVNLIPHVMNTIIK